MKTFTDAAGRTWTIALNLGTAKAYSSMGDQVAKMAKRTGFGIEALSELTFVASQTGTSLEAMEAGFRRMQRSIYDAGRGLSTAADALADLGLTFEALDGLSPERQIGLAKVRDNYRTWATDLSMRGVTQALIDRALLPALPQPFPRHWGLFLWKGVFAPMM